MQIRYLLFVFCSFYFLIFSNQTHAQWEQANGLYNGSINSLAVKGNDLFAGGEYGEVFRSTDNGFTWQLANSGLPNERIGNLISLGNYLFAGTSNSGVYLSSDNGSNWVEANSGLPFDVLSFAVLGSNIFAGTLGNSFQCVFRSTDNGSSWQNVSIGLDDPFINSLTANSTYLFAGTGNGVYVSTNNGDNWTITTMSGYIGSIVAFGTNVFAATNSGVYLSTDTGTNWTQTSLFDPGVQSFAINGASVFAGGSNGVYFTTDNGNTWTDVSIIVQGDNVSSLIFNNSNLFAGTNSGGNQGGVFLSTNNGANWQATGLGLTNLHVHAFIQKGNYIFAGTYGSGVFRSTDSGTNWYGASIGITEPSPYVECFTIKDQNLFVGIGGGIFLSTDDGNTWQERSNGLGLYSWVRALAVSGSSIFAAGNSATGIVFRSTDDGMNWIDVSSGQITGAIVSFAVIGSNIFTVGMDVYLSTNNGTTWNSVGLSNLGVHSLAVIGNNLFAGSGSYGVFRSTNNGTDWVQVNTGLTDTTIATFAVSGTNLFAGTFDGRVFVSTNYGDSWDEVNNEGLPQLFSMQSLYSNEDYLFIGSGLGIFRRHIDKIIPTELTSFTASANNNNIELNWSTATETNNQGFEIERLQNYKIERLQEWEKIGFVQGHGTTTEIQTYFFSDKNLKPGSYSYRLKQIDYDGTYAYSDIVEVDVTGPKEFTLYQNYPNPFNPSTTIKFALPFESKVKISVYNLVGELVSVLLDKEIETGYHEVNFDASRLASGVYLYRIKAGEFVQTKKLILMK